MNKSLLNIILSAHLNQCVFAKYFQQWLFGYLAAHQDLNQSVLPHAILQVGNREQSKLGTIDKISAGICSFSRGVNVIAQACHKQGLKIPDDVAIIGAGDPGDVIVSSLGCTLTVVRPDYLSLSQTIRQILDEKITAENAFVINSPVKWVYRASTA